jgi:hypothetical protein
MLSLRADTRAAHKESIEMTPSIYHMQDFQPALRRRAELQAIHRASMKRAFVVTFWGGYVFACASLWKYIYTHAHLMGF